MKLFLVLGCFLSILATSAQGKPEGLYINSRAPEFKGVDQNAKPVSLKELRKKGSVVLLFYRGYWCPYCNKELKRFADSLQLITDKGASVVAISPEGDEGRTKTTVATKASYSFISDKDASISQAYKSAYKVDDKTTNRYKSFGIDLLNVNGQKGVPQLPIPAVYIVNKDGYISYRFFEEDYKKRPWVSDILKQL